MAQPRAFDIPAQDAGRSIPELARQAGIQIIAPGQVLHGLITPAIKGQFEVQDALAQLLYGSRLSIASNDGHVIVLAVARPPVPPPGRTAPPAQSEPVEQIVVTGSRTISDASRSPAPMMTFLIASLSSTTPSNISDALNKLPVFQGSTSQRNQSNAGFNGAGNVLNLRNFGAQRTLILLDGHRVPATSAAGTVDINTLPQMLITRVDVVTGGASAVYGSDAVTGVVNFILDKNFSGVKYSANMGISSHMDAASHQAGVAAGTSLFGGRGHIEGALQYYHSDGLLMSSRPLGAQAWGSFGTGTPANPFGNVINGRLALSSFGGVITCSNCTANGQQFVRDGVIGPFNHGTLPAPGSQIESGGDGSYVSKASLTASLKHAELFGRFSYNLDDDTAFWVQGTGTESINFSHFFNSQIDIGRGTATYFKNNPFLPAPAQAALGDNGAYDSGNTFTMQKWLDNQVGRGTAATVRSLSIGAGLEGSLFGKYDWDLYYTHGESRSSIKGINNGNNQLHMAQNDTVIENAVIKCYSNTAAAIALYGDLYPGCVPINPFGPTSITNEAYNYSVGTTKFALTNIMDDIGGSISGDVFDLPAGPVKMALSGEIRLLDYTVDSNASPTQRVNCTGLRLCNPAIPYWDNNTVATVHAAQDVWEFAGEVVVPLLKDIPFIQSFDVNAAGRYTNYSASGAVQTWKIGMDWHVDDTVRLRGTTSVDIRAPTLNDLFAPLQSASTGYFDLHTNSAGVGTQTISQGNPGLVPEVARTYTVGIVLTPGFIPGLTASVDFYNINLKNAIGSIAAANTQVQTICELSGGSSPYCALYQRPLPFSDTSPANYPTAIYNIAFNSAFAATEGVDYEVNYQFNLADIDETLPGGVTLRALANVAPKINTMGFPGAALTRTTNSKSRASIFAGYTVGDWSVNTLFRWFSGFSRVAILNTTTQNYIQPRIPSFDTFDVSIDRTFRLGEADMNLYFSVQNALDSTPPVVSGAGGNPGLVYPGPPGQDVVGRYFTMGVRGSF